MWRSPRRAHRRRRRCGRRRGGAWPGDPPGTRPPLRSRSPSPPRRFARGRRHRLTFERAKPGDLDTVRGLQQEAAAPRAGTSVGSCRLRRPVPAPVVRLRVPQPWVPDVTMDPQPVKSVTSGQRGPCRGRLLTVDHLRHLSPQARGGRLGGPTAGSSTPARASSLLAFDDPATVRAVRAVRAVGRPTLVTAGTSAAYADG